ncbi:MAG: trigger factor [Candidatus Omnitrophica bacterium]|nr:trigger factor [Candidatus Omnitrophota bacterium]
MKLKVDVKDVSSCEKVLTIDVPSEMVTEEFSAFYESVGKRAKIPGFRPGHAPKHVVALHFRDEARQEVWKQLVSRTFRSAVDQEELPIIGYPQIEQVEFDETRLKFKAHVEMKPKVKIDKYAGLSVKREAVQVDEPEVEGALKQLQESHAKFQVVEGREARLGDFLICSYRLRVEDKDVEKRDGEWIEIREQDYLEGFSKQLLGVKIGEMREARVTFPSNYVKKELAGKQGLFFVTVQEIKEKMLPPLNDEFAKEASESETLEELRKKVRDDLEHHRKMETERKLEHLLLEELIKKSKFELPARLVERRLEALVRQSIQSLVYRGVKEEEALREKENLKKNLLPEAQREVRISFILDEIATREHIQASDEELNRKYREVADRLRRPIEEVKTYYQESEDRKESLREQMVTEKTIQWVKDKAIIAEGGLK